MHPLIYLSFLLLSLLKYDNGWEFLKQELSIEYINVAPESLSPGDLIITEIMHRPSAVTDAQGEYFELVNTTGLHVQLMGMTFFDDGSNAIEIFTPLEIGPGGILLFGPNGDSTTNGGISVDYVYNYADFQLADTTDAIYLYDTLFTLIDGVTWDNGIAFPNPYGASMALDPESTHHLANDMGDNWCTGTTTYGDGDQGTPGQFNSVCNPPFISITNGLFINDCECCEDEEGEAGVQLGGYGGN